MATLPKRKRPTDIRGALEQRALDLGHVFVVLQLPPSSFEDAVTQPMPRLATYG
jgi:hypothetical protein